MNKHGMAYTVIRRAYLDGMAEGVGRRALGYAEDMAGEYAAANAEPLLDAAPDLLAALENLLMWDDGGNEPGDLPGDLIDEARAAIQKAVGNE